MGTPAGVLRVQASRCSSSSSRAWACSPRRSGPCGTSCARCSAATRPRPHPLALYLPWLCLPRLYVPWLYVPWLYVPWLWLCPPCPPRQANAEALQLIDSALFVLCLDDDAPPTPAAVARTMLHGTYAMNGDGVQVGSLTNRWYDKMQIIVCANGSAGVNFEHTSVDGHTVLPSASTLHRGVIAAVPPHGSARRVWRLHLSSSPRWSDGRVDVHPGHLHGGGRRRR